MTSLDMLGNDESTSIRGTVVHGDAWQWAMDIHLDNVLPNVSCRAYDQHVDVLGRLGPVLGVRSSVAH